MKLRVNHQVHVVDLGDRRVEYRLRSSRSAKRCRLRVRPAGVEVVVPQEAEEGRAEIFLRENETWVLDQLAFLDRMGSVRARVERAGDHVLLRGTDTPVEIVEEATGRGYGLVTQVEGGLRIRVPRGKSVDPRQTLEGWMRRQARVDILARLEDRRGQMPRTKYGRVYIMGQRTKWGGCSGQRNLSFNWRLVMAPPAVLDYIVVHELAHLAEPSHSTKFWLLVRTHCPRFEEHKAWLKDNEARMQLPGDCFQS